MYMSGTAQTDPFAKRNPTAQLPVTSAASTRQRSYVAPSEARSTVEDELVFVVNVVVRKFAE